MTIPPPPPLPLPLAGEPRHRSDRPARSLTPQQEHAVVRRSGSLLLAAGAGSGKTSVLVERFVRAVREDGIAPGRILAITFTERACGELRERVRARLLELRERDAAREAEEAFVSTFHGFCARVLRTHPLQAGLTPGFRVLEEGLASRLRGLAFREALGGFLDGEPPDRVDLVAAYGVDALQRIVLGSHSQLRTQGQSEPRLAIPTTHRNGEQERGGLERGGLERGGLERGGLERGGLERGGLERGGLERRALEACRLIDNLLERFGSAYRERKRRRGALDFDDLELCARDLLREDQTIRSAWSERFQMLMVDEFQDTNPRQLELLELLDRHNLFTVGDEQQSIYGFRHADVTLFRDRRERLGREGAALALTENFRSTPPILAAVQRVFTERLGDSHTPLVAAREPAPSGDPVVELLLTDSRGWGASGGSAPGSALGGGELPAQGSPWRVAEARALAERIAALVQEGAAQAGDVVVLLRALGDLPLYESALRAAGLPTLSGVGDFWGHRQVEDLIAYLRALCNPLDELALYGVLASPLVGISSDGLALIARAARERKDGVWGTIERGVAPPDPLSPRDAQRLRSFRAWFSLERSGAALHPLAELLRRAIAWSGYEHHVLSLDWGEHRLGNVRKLLRLTRGFEAEEGRDLRGFLDHVAHLGDTLGSREGDAHLPDAQLEAVRLLSIHSAKGLEFPVVCVADLGRSPTLSVPDLLVECDGRLGLRLATLGDPELTPALDFEQLRRESQAAQQQEEDRILYVAMTRARERLLLSGSIDFARPPTPKQGSPPIAWVAPALIPDIRSLLEGEEAESVLEGGEAEWTVELDETLTVRCLFNRPTRECPPDRGRTLVDPPGRTSSQRQHSTAVLAREAIDACDPVVEPVQQCSPLEDPDATVSYSSLTELERCGYRYYLERVLRMGERRGPRPETGDGGVEGRTRGIIIHLLLERIDFAHPHPPSESDVARTARGVGVRLVRSERDALASLIARALDSEMAQRIAHGGNPRREHPFAFSLTPEHPLVTGAFDVLMSDPDGCTLVVDYKSDRIGADEDLEELVRKRYGLQQLLYAIAALEGAADRVQIVHWFLERPHDPVCATFQAPDRDALREQLLERLLELRGKGFLVARVPHRGICLTCPGRGTLCSWAETHTLRERSPTLEDPQRVATLSI